MDKNMDAALKPTPYDPPQWNKRGPVVATEGTALIKAVDQLAAEMEARWGFDRLQHLVPLDLAQKFARQQALYNGAVWHGDLQDVEREAARMQNAWRALDAVATQAGHPTAAEVMQRVPFVEVRLPDGTLCVIVADAHAGVIRDPALQVWTASEVARVLEAVPVAIAAKNHFPGTEVVASTPPGKRFKAASVTLPDDEIDIPF